MAIERKDFNFKKTGDIIVYLNDQSDNISPEDIKTLYDILIDIRPTPQDLAKFLDACANASVFYMVDDSTSTTTDIFKDIFGRYPSAVIETARDEYDCSVPEDAVAVDSDTVFDVIVKDYYADDIYNLLNTAVKAAKGIIEPDEDC